MGVSTHIESTFVGGPSDCAATTDNSNAPKRRRKGRDRKKKNRMLTSLAAKASRGKQTKQALEDLAQPVA